MKLNFQKNVLFGDIWPQNRQNVTQTYVFAGHFLDFASLVFLDFAHNDRWAWCLVVFLQFAGPVSVFLLSFWFRTAFLKDTSIKCFMTCYFENFLHIILILSIVKLFPHLWLRHSNIWRSWRKERTENNIKLGKIYFLCNLGWRNFHIPEK